MAVNTAIIIGVGPFISRSLALYLIRQGYNLGLIGRTHAKLDRLETELKKDSEAVEISTCTADAGEPEALTQALNILKRKLGGKVDVLIYNAARVGPNALLDLDAETFRQDFNSAAVGTLVAGQWFCKNADLSGHPLLLVTGGTLDRSPNADYASLSAVKSASQSIAVMLSQVLPKHGILVGTPLIVEPIIPKDNKGGYVTKSEPDVIVNKLFEPYFQERERGGNDWTVERIW